MTDKTDDRPRTASPRLFDIRNIIAALLGLYGLGLLIAGLFPGLAEAGANLERHARDVTDMAAGSSANLWVGAGMVLTAAAFAVWAAVRPAREEPGPG